MNRRLRIAVAAGLVVLLVAAAVLAFGFWQFTRPVPESYSHTAEYRAYLQPDATLTDVTLYLPLPVENGSSPAGDALVSGSPGVVDAPPGWSFAVEDTAYGPMLALSFPELAPNYVERPPPRTVDPDGTTAAPGTATPTVAPGRTPIRTLDSYLVSVELAFEEPIDTRSPADSEAVLRPRLNATEVPCDELTGEEAVCRRFGTRMYLSYDAPENATVDVLVTYEGRNDWFAGGWTGNSFRQSTRVVATGDGPGWVAVDGEETTGVGTYRGAPAAVVDAGAVERTE
ncbi:hypothetical protein [Halobaculum roseum]|uniref:Uncharacterized protein n=1 Tax=Halobaculum roseum TaxID=2175149 RepID=A0ABD5MQ59_9EURY|nr:hypothetical protein [Halobaculum roseum]QZY01310.1 hypothetical protein K6T36_08070 [Halobaculum roseum]